MIWRWLTRFQRRVFLASCLRKQLTTLRVKTSNFFHALLNQLNKLALWDRLNSRVTTPTFSSLLKRPEPWSECNSMLKARSRMKSQLTGSLSQQLVTYCRLCNTVPKRFSTPPTKAR
jgi:hypothetical protein